MEVDACVRCGFCCSRSACAFGIWDGKKCVFHSYGENGQSTCLAYTHIIAQPDSIVSPAFGCGCCSNLNTERRKIVIKFHNGISPKINITGYGDDDGKG